MSYFDFSGATVPVTSWLAATVSAQDALIRCVTCRRAGNAHAKKIVRNSTNCESWWWPTTRFGPRRPAPYRSASRRGRQFCSTVLRISSFSHHEIPRKSLRSRRPVDRSLAILKSPAKSRRGESAPRDRSYSSESSIFEQVFSFAFQFRVDKIVAILFHSRDWKRNDTNAGY